MQCTITSPERTEVFKEVESLFLPTQTGEADVLPHHADAFFALQPGKLRLRDASGERVFSVSRGVCSVFSGDAVIMTPHRYSVEPTSVL